MSRQSRFKWVVCMMACVIVLALFSPGAEAIGVTPGRTTLDFEPGLERSVTFTIVNNEHLEFNALVYVEGDLKDHVTLEKNIVEFRETDNSKPFTYRVKLPEKIEKPGDHWAKIVVMQLPPGMESEKLEGQFVIATTAVIHQLRVKVPYPGKYADIGLEIQEAEPNETVMFFVKVYNLGKEKIYKAHATIDILGPTNERIYTLESEDISIEPKKTGEIIIPWKADVHPGVYQAVVTLNYDGKVASTRKNFGVGTLRIEVLGVKVRNFVLGQVAKFEIEIRNLWNQRVEDVYAEMEITNQNGDRVANFKSASSDIEPLQRATLYAYWDTEGVERGTYDAKLVLHYADKTTTKLLKAYVELESLETEIIGVTARAVRKKGEPGPGTNMLVPLVLILVFINIGWFFYFRRRGKSMQTRFISQ